MAGKMLQDIKTLGSIFSLTLSRLLAHTREIQHRETHSAPKALQLLYNLILTQEYYRAAVLYAEKLIRPW